MIENDSYLSVKARTNDKNISVNDIPINNIFVNDSLTIMRTTIMKCDQVLSHDVDNYINRVMLSTPRNVKH